MQTTLRLPALALLLLALALAGCSGGGDAGEADLGSAGGGGEGVAGEGVAGEAPASEDVGDGRASAIGDLPGLGPMVVKTAELAVVVEDGRLDDAVAGARRVASRFGGFVVSSSRERFDDAHPQQASLVLRVPERSHDDAMIALARLGEVELEADDTEDVSQEFVDLEARRRHLEAVEGRLLELLERAQTVQAALAVQAQLNSTQLELEGVRGRIRFLENRTAYSTITLELREPAPDDTPPAAGWGIGDAWKAGAHAFLTVVRWLVVLVAAAAPFLVLAAAGLLVARVVRRRRRRAAAPAG